MVITYELPRVYSPYRHKIETPEQFASSAKHCTDMELDGLVSTYTYTYMELDGLVSEPVSCLFPACFLPVSCLFPACFMPVSYEFSRFPMYSPYIKEAPPKTPPIHISISISISNSSTKGGDRRRRFQHQRSPSRGVFCYPEAPYQGHYYHIWTYDPRFYSPNDCCSLLTPLVVRSVGGWIALNLRCLALLCLDSKVCGCPKTIDGDLKNEFIEVTTVKHKRNLFFLLSEIMFLYVLLCVFYVITD
jgi:hypothetical protein